MAVPGIGYPTGSPDLVGYRLSDCRVAWCEDKTLNDTLKKKQKEQMKRFLFDGCLVFEAHERADGFIDGFTREQRAG